MLNLKLNYIKCKLIPTNITMVKICDNTYTSESDKYNDIFNKYPFELDHFQKYAIEGIEEKKHILITAHTGSGKTLPSEYAIEKFCNEGKKVIYTSPIKSLSNQKYHEFSKKFPHISFGILTGDIKFNPEADCLIMTTEILRNTLFLKDKDEITKSQLHFDMDIENELGCVIFDEVHYINDQDRGSVWEETIMKMPKQVIMVMLSATIDKAHEFAKWIETIKQREVWLATTNIRVVPLTHYIYYKMNQEMYKKTTDKQMEKQLKKIDGKVIPLKKQNEQVDTEMLHHLYKCNNYNMKHRYFTKPHHTFNSIVKELKERNMLPAICFVFSRKKVEQYANMIEKSLFNEDETHFVNVIEKECSEILRKLPNYKEYLSMPEFTQMVKLLEKGIAIHHSGILPVLREMIELLFSKGYIKLLFATETFAVGINMPTKTVLFTSLSKFSGSGMRNLYSHEYTQMAGRAGRRGLDKVGHVIHLNNMFEPPSENEYKHILGGKPQTLLSKFHIDFGIVLKLISNNDNDFKSFVCKSMRNKELVQYVNQRYKTLDELETQLTSLVLDPQIKQDMYDYETLKNSPNLRKQKKRRQIEQKMKKIEDTYKRFDSYFKQYTDYIKREKEIQDMKNELEYLDNDISICVNTLLDYLYENKYIEVSDNNNVSDNNKQYKLTIKGIIANSIQEVEGMVFTDIILDGYLDNLTPELLASVLSSFTNIRVKDDFKTYIPDYNSECDFILSKISKEYTQYSDVCNKLEFVKQVDNEMIYDINQEVLQWCLATNETECKQVIETLRNKEIFVGEFVKALMKINNIASELEATCDLIGNIKLKNILVKIPNLTLKYVATNQSLYI